MTNNDNNQEKNKNSNNNSNNSRNSNKLTVSSSSITTTTIGNTQPGVFPVSPADLEDIRIAYTTTIEKEMNATVAWFIEKCLNAGINADVIEDAIFRTGWAKRPSPFYLRAILNRYMKEGIKTLQDVADDEAELRSHQDRFGADMWKDWYRN